MYGSLTLCVCVFVHVFVKGISYFMSKGILVDHPTELAKFIFYTRRLNWKMLRIYLDERLTLRHKEKHK